MTKKQGTDRRDFIKKSSVLATALSLGAAPAITANAADSGNLVRIGWIGTGGRGCYLMRKVVKLPNVRIDALCDIYDPNLEGGKKYCANDKVRTYHDLGNMLKSEKEIDCVFVTTPLSWHSRHAIQALRAGKYVFCEKTMAHTVEAANEMVKAVRETGKFLQVGLQRRYSPVYRKAVNMVHKEAVLGRITQIRCQWNRNRAWRRHIPPDYPKGMDTTLCRKYYPDLEHHLNWRLYWATSGGLMTELGSHQLDVCSWMLGTHPSSVQACGGIDYWRDGREVFDNVHVLYEFEIKKTEKNAKSFFSSVWGNRNPGDKPYTATVAYTSIQANAHDGCTEEIMGDRGTMYLSLSKGLLFEEASAPKLAWGTRAESAEKQAAKNAAVITSGATHNVSLEPQKDEGQPFTRPMVGMDEVDIELSSFFNCIRENREPYCNVITGRNDAVMVLSANEAIKKKKRIPLDESLYI